VDPDDDGNREPARRLILKLDVEETNIDRLEKSSCEEIFAEREPEYQESYQRIPALDELCSRYDDPTNRGST